MTEFTEVDVFEVRLRNARIQNMLGIGLGEFRRIKSNITLCNMIEEANSVKDLKGILTDIVDEMYPCSKEEWDVFKKEFDL